MTKGGRFARAPGGEIDETPVEAVMVLVGDGPEGALRVRRASPEFGRVTGHGAEALVGRSLDDLQGAGGLAADFASLEASLRAGRPWTGETLGQRPDGAPLALRWCVSPLVGAATERPEFVARLRALTRDDPADLIGPAMRHAADAVVLADDAGRIAAANPAASDIFGWGHGELVGQSLDVLLPGAYRARHAALLQAYLRDDGAPRAMSERSRIAGRRRDGSLFPAEASIFSMEQGGRKLAGVALRDVSRRLEHEAELAELQRRFRATFELSFQFSGLIDREGRLLEVNRTALDYIGVEREQVVGERFVETPWFQGNPEAYQAMEGWIETARRGEPVRGTAPLIGRDGVRRIFDVSLRPVFGSDGALLYIIPEGRDVTDIVQAAEALQRKEAALRRAQAIGRMGDWVLDVPSGALTWSDEVYRLFGEQPQAFPPTYEEFLARVHSEDRDRVRAGVDDALSGRAAYRLDHRIVLPDGEARVVHEQAEVLFDEAGAPKTMQGVIQDITERKEAEAILLKALDSAERAAVAKSDFLARMSHELRTPLNAVLGYSEMIEKQLFGPIENARYLGYAGNIRQSGEHLLALVNDLLDFTRLDSRAGGMDVQPIDLRQAVSDALRVIYPQAREMGVRLRTALGRNPPRPAGDARAVKQILINLLSNAVKFSARGQRVLVAASLDETGRQVVLSVVDQGRGMPPAVLAKIGEPFLHDGAAYSTPAHGAGLGLAIVKRLCEAMGGRMSAESVEGRGARIDVALPLSQGARGATCGSRAPSRVE